MRRPRFDRAAGLSLLELLLAASLLVVLGSKAFLVTRSVLTFSNSESSRMVLEDRAEEILDKIAYCLMGAARETLLPEAEAPLYSESIGYRILLGVEEGEVIFGKPERIGTTVDEDNQLIWWEDPDSPEERSVVWTNLVRPLLEGELLNGVDDNGNGLVDEKGICFDIDGGSVVIRITLGDESTESMTMERTVTGVVTCRNFIE